jgi:hypothetical protein
MYVKRPADIDGNVLKTLLKRSIALVKKTYPQKQVALTRPRRPGASSVLQLTVASSRTPRAK